MQFMSVLFSLVAVANGIVAGLQTILARQPLTLPGVRTYIEGVHVEIDATIKPIQ